MYIIFRSLYPFSPFPFMPMAEITHICVLHGLQILFLIMVLGLCLATGVCVGVVDMLRIFIGLPPGAEDDTYADEDFAQRKYGTVEKRSSGVVGPGVEGGGDMRRFASERYAEDKGWA